MKKKMFRNLVETITIMMMMVFMLGCSPAYQYPSRIPFPIEEYEKLPAIDSGTATIRGQAFLKTVDGTVKYAAGCTILLNPVTSYSNQWYNEYHLSIQRRTNAARKDFFAGMAVASQHMDWNLIEWKKISRPDYRLENYVAKAIADGEGRFEFENVPAGEYYVATSITWGVPQVSGYSSYIHHTGRMLAKKISIKDGQELKIILTQ